MISVPRRDPSYCLGLGDLEASKEWAPAGWRGMGICWKGAPAVAGTMSECPGCSWPGGESSCLPQNIPLVAYLSYSS